MERTQNISRVVDLTHPEKNVIFNMSHAEAVDIVRRGDPAGIREIDGQFALVSADVRCATSSPN
jgi:asparagine synthase (glutamine-hydrolysing)